MVGVGLGILRGRGAPARFLSRIRAGALGQKRLTLIERSRLRRWSGVEIVVDVRRLRKQTNLVRVVANAPFFAACLCAEFRVLWSGAATAEKCRIDRR